MTPRTTSTFTLVTSLAITLTLGLSIAYIASIHLSSSHLFTLQKPQTSNIASTSLNQLGIDHDIRGHVPGRIPYLSVYNHIPNYLKPLGLTSLLLWLMVLFMCLSIVAGDYFCPNLSVLAHRLGLSESVAGVTFLGFGNGSPDIFSTFTALKAGTGSLALGELIGAALFIVSVVAGSMSLVRPFRVPATSFLRDVGFLTFAVAYALLIMIDGLIELWEAVGMVIIYCIYVLFVALGSQNSQSGLLVLSIEADCEALGEENNLADHSDLTLAKQAVNLNISSLGGLIPRCPTTEAANERTSLLPSTSDPAPSRKPILIRSTTSSSLTATSQPSNLSYSTQEFNLRPPSLRPSLLSALGYQPTLDERPLSQFLQIPHSNHRNRSRSLLQPPNRPRPSYGRSDSTPISPSKPSPHSSSLFPLPSQSGSSSFDSSSGQNSVMNDQCLCPIPPDSVSSSSGCSSWKSSTQPPSRSSFYKFPTRNGTSSSLKSISVTDLDPNTTNIPNKTSCLRLILDSLCPQLNNLTQHPWPSKTVAVVSSPAVMLFNLTLPVVEECRREDMIEDDRLQTIPQIENEVEGDQSPSKLSYLHLLLAPSFCLTVFWPEGSDGIKSGYGTSIALALMIGVMSALAFWWIRRRMEVCLAMVGFAVSIAWISTIINEVLGVLECLGKILGLSDAVIGLTIFAIGNSLTDLVSDLTVARMGFPVMAISACYGGPLINILLGVGLSSIYLILHQEGEAYSLETSMTLMISIFELLLILILTLVFVPLNAFWIDERWGWSLILVYGIGILLNLMFGVWCSFQSLN